jgi:membrane protein implicated in regulation of membrane protease activity
MRQQDDDWRYDPPADFHDPTAGIGGAPPAVSALTLRSVLAVGGLAACIAGVVITLIAGGPIVLAVLLVVIAATALVDLSVIAVRRRAQRP